ncbi:methionine ABC transporter substrate-binding protein [Ornithinibacillus gellani]|uniref:MetQ/NlpA family ABC transporter substrate-binding protein n=1 Tax=Ornithinibacillus gellani TaxID=2293253 RepID=UPI000F4767ED|nr:MetQ/NlpA family ABC transporter substrate-binding protein [Ornithinibacillus gellani]TQS76020.1 methionine ABC transporter substrate-binding protein [Ornithinibacillus gellani]
MKKLWTILFLSLILLLAACGKGDADKSADGDKDSGNADGENTEIIVGASSEPHAEILEEAKPLLEEKGIALEIEPYQDYVFPNDDLESGKLDANFFQHIPYLKETIDKTGYDLDYIDGIHIEPMGVYSKDIASIDDIQKGTEVIMSNSVADHGRILSLFEKNGLLKLDPEVDKGSATLEDVVENPKELKFSPEYEPALLPEFYHSEKNVLVAINTNYAIGADLNPLEDALFIEDEDSEYVNVIAVRSEDKDNEALKTLVEVLHSKEIQDFILEKYDGAVVPVGGNN